MHRRGLYAQACQPRVGLQRSQPDGLRPLSSQKGAVHSWAAQIDGESQQWSRSCVALGEKERSSLLQPYFDIKVLIVLR